jgi:hypothetical protein
VWRRNERQNRNGEDKRNRNKKLDSTTR